VRLPGGALWAQCSGLKIGLIILHADERRGGAERYTLDLARSLAHRGHDVTLLASSFHDCPWEVKQIACSTKGVGKTMGYSRFLAQLDEHLQAVNFDILHAMLPVHRCDLYHPHAGLAIENVRTGHLKHTSKLKQMLAKWGNRFNPRRQKYAKVEQQLLLSTPPPMVLCLSDYVRRSVRGRYALPEQCLPVLFNAVDLRRFDPKRKPEAGAAVRMSLGIGHDHVVALMIAQDFDRKGLDSAIRAVARCTDGRLRLLVVGRDNPSKYQKLAGKLGAEKRVIFAGPADDTYAYYRAADFFILPTRHDPCSLVVLEALAMGLPVITTSRNGAAEVMTNNLDGMIVNDPNDVIRLTEAIKTLTDDRTRQNMSAAALTLRPKLSYDQHVNTLIGIYQQALDRKRRPTAGRN